jgi:hypothetical protein
MMIEPLRMVRRRCDGCMWVCEERQNRPWEGPLACNCGAAGAPCPIRNMAEPPQLPRGFTDEGSGH